MTFERVTIHRALIVLAAWAAYTWGHTRGWDRGVEHQRSLR